MSESDVDYDDLFATKWNKKNAKVFLEDRHKFISKEKYDEFASFACKNKKHLQTLRF